MVHHVQARAIDNDEGHKLPGIARRSPWHTPRRGEECPCANSPLAERGRMRWLRGGPSAALTHGGHGMLRRAKGLSW